MFAISVTFNEMFMLYINSSNAHPPPRDCFLPTCRGTWLQETTLYCSALYWQLCYQPLFSAEIIEVKRGRGKDDKWKVIIFRHPGHLFSLCYLRLFSRPSRHWSLSACQSGLLCKSLGRFWKFHNCSVCLAAKERAAPVWDPTFCELCKRPVYAL